MRCESIKSKVVSLFADKNELLYAIPGGLIGVGLKLDPSLTKSNKLLGNILGYPGKLPDVFTVIEVTYHLLKKLVGVKSDTATGNKIRKITNGEILLINVRSLSTGGRVENITDKTITISLLFAPCCAEIGEKVSISRKIENKWRLIGWGTIEKGQTVGKA